MIKNYNKILIKLLIFLGVIFSFFILIDVKSERGGLNFSFHPVIDFSFVEIALGKSLETKYYSSFLGILCYFLAVILIIINSKKKVLINFFSLIFLVALLIFEMYCVYLVSVGNFSGQHLRISVPLFLLIFYLYRRN